VSLFGSVASTILCPIRINTYTVYCLVYWFCEITTSHVASNCMFCFYMISLAIVSYLPTIVDAMSSYLCEVLSS
jgi:hypothetical protein